MIQSSLKFYLICYMFQLFYYYNTIYGARRYQPIRKHCFNPPCETTEMTTERHNGFVNYDYERYCRKSLTKISGFATNMTYCGGDVIFEDNFDNLSEDWWQIEHKLPTEHPEYPFVSYQRRSVKVENGYLKISPYILQSLSGFDNESVYSDDLDLWEGCTETTEDQCYMKPFGSNILPPVVSGRIHMKDFAFKYGEVEIRAKLPKGDWIYPELLLEPLLHKYGRGNFASGLIKIASVHGNNYLYDGPNDYCNKILYSGVIMNFKCFSTFIKSKSNLSGRWTDDFHHYSLVWEPGAITFRIDDVEWFTISILSRKNLRDGFPEDLCPDAPRDMWASGDSIAPFDEYFYLTLGLAAGGMTEFKDNIRTSGRKPKPWKNLGSKAKFHFWKEIGAWFKTWDENSVLLVDKVRIIAL